MNVTRTTMLALLLVVAVTNQGDATQELDASASLTAKEIVDRVKSMYAGCQAYSDSGSHKCRSTSDDGVENVEMTFQTAYASPGRLRFELQESGERYLIQVDGDQNRKWWSKSSKVTHPPTAGRAIAGATGVSHGVAGLIPALLLPEKVKNWGGISIRGIHRIEDGVIAESECYRLKSIPVGTGPNRTTTLWIEKTTYTILRVDQQMIIRSLNLQTEETTTYKPVFNSEVTDEMLKFDPPAMK